MALYSRHGTMMYFCGNQTDHMLRGGEWVRSLCTEVMTNNKFHFCGENVCRLEQTFNLTDG